MKRGTFGVIVCALAALAGACKGKSGSKQRVPGAERASTARLIKTLEAVKSFPDGSLMALVEGVVEECGKGCACLGPSSGTEAGNARASLLSCPSLCTIDARAKAKAAAPGQEVTTLAAVCTPSRIGLTDDTVKKVSNDWLAAFVAGQYLADQVALAGADQQAVESAMKDVTVPLAPTAGMAGVVVASAERAGPVGDGRIYVAIDANGGFHAGRTLRARFTATGAELVPPVAKTLTDAKDLREYVTALTAGPVADLKAAPSDDPPPPEPEQEEEKDESGGTGTAMALEEGKMGKKDSIRAEGQYKMKNTNVDPQLARQQAIEAARSAGILGKVAPGDSPFAHVVGTGDFTAGFDDAEIYGGRLGGPTHSALGLTSVPIRDQIVVFADRQAPAQKVIEALTAVPGGAVLAVEHEGHIAAVPVVFGGGGPSGWGNISAQAIDDKRLDLVIDVGAEKVLVGSTIGDWTELKVTGGTVDLAAVEKAVGDLLKDALFADRRDVVVSVRDDAKVAQMMPAIDAALGAGARAIRLETWFDRSAGTGWGTFGTGTDPGTVGRTGRSAAAVPQVSIGLPVATGDLDKAIIRRYIKRNIPKITYCYEKQLLVKPKLAGTVTAQFFIAPTGIVATSNASGVSPEVASCVAAVIKEIVFRKPKGGGGVQVNYPFTFRPTGG